MRVYTSIGDSQLRSKRSGFDHTVSFFLLFIFAGTVLRPFASLLFVGIVVFSESKWHQEEHPKRATPLSLVCAVKRRPPCYFFVVAGPLFYAVLKKL